MIYITQLIYLKAGQEEAFHAFEAVAIPIIGKYRGQLLFRIRPTSETVIDSGSEIPYEIHLVSFPAEADFENFKHDEERKQYLHLKEQAIREVLLIKGGSI
ncbi:DUF1330 domain-containing protein [Catalinimonas niigatensis]|uniref:DUF1330 domain-containing protein n=1 Tax=Catalinimonas niigatensis TaxID=1397264 RepID=UPI0026671178|nr:DUF1330 domain-containing protein [Catalinimonas niigatensis]WPP49368.1 DUF1330 domain-containing protein [Catalinimonas niigatensis]